MKRERSRRCRLPTLLAVTTIALAGAGLRGRVVLNTGPFDCDGTLRVTRWANPEGRSLFVRKATLWAGMTYRGRADYDGAVYRESDGSLLVQLAWDHYGDPSAPHTIVQDFAPDWLELAAGDALVLHSWCRRVNGSRATQGHHVGAIWWSEAP
jgi:hypothetical protein